MSKKRIAVSLFVILIAVLLNIAVINYTVPDKNYTLTVEITLNSDEENGVQLYYMADDRTLTEGFLENDMKSDNYDQIGREQTLTYSVPGNVGYLRLDIGVGQSSGYISDIVISSGKAGAGIFPECYGDVLEVNDLSVTAQQDRLYIEADGEDPYLIWNVASWGISDVVQEGHALQALLCRILVCLFLDVIFLYILVFARKTAVIPQELWHNRKLIFQLAKNDFKTKFAGSYLGIIWAFIQPIVTVLVYWFVFQKGLKSGGINTSAGITVPFVLWLVAGLVPWFFFSDALNGGTNALIEYSYLVKKVVFKISILPIVKVLSALFVHLFFIIFTLCLYAGYRYFPDLYTLQILYYSFCTFILVLGLSYATCALVGFFRDLTQIINIVLQVGVWMTPIMWNIETMELPAGLITVFKLNPMYYVVAGYRDALINKVWFWENPGLTVYFWIFTVIVFGVGMIIFKRLKVHFADVL